MLQSGYGDTRIITFHASYNSFWKNTAKDTISFRYNVPYVEKAYFGSLKVGSTKQLNLNNSDWSDWTVKTSNTAVAQINTMGKITITGKGTATITLTSKSIADLSIKVLVSSSSLTSTAAKSKAGTFYSKNSEVYDSTSQVLAGDYVKK